ncbi:LacI family DNA-binding transcriptional regulator [Uliginosibacterium sp. 31-16]|uniref:LacI family DNA-binding transcriptional regulator n=1 Tax=Uliginosibacterium sp. 31-16 TaxID=3068315 RepID=UPI00273D94B2|nr:LacI family DNA-binding transcriptional regulator [Uliginosibacterium sp. 31-16]MDP5240424.1 LacI family DNA-binding transcriptional regulator [Uliginosibacterium sp. 31-16]
MANNLSSDKRITLADVAKLAGVSKQTVSRVINDSEHVTEETRVKVLQCIDVLGFRPSALARQLSTGRSYTLGIVGCSGVGYLTSGVAYIGMVRQADKMGYALLIKELTDFSPAAIHTMLDYLIERQVDGVIWAGPEVGDSHAWLDTFDLNALPMPVVQVNAKARAGVDTVAYDNFDAGRVVTRHLISLGRKRIGHISGPMDRWVAQERVKGWRAELDAAGLPECKEYFAEGDWEPGTGGPGLKRLLEICPDLDAVFVGSDRMALGVLYEAHQMGLRVPEDLAVMAIDNLPESAFFIPPLSTMNQNTPEMAERALRQLVRRICERRGEPYPAACAQPEESLMHHEMVLRESSLGKNAPK